MFSLHADIMHIRFYLHNCLSLSFILTISIHIGSALHLRYVVHACSPFYEYAWFVWTSFMFDTILYCFDCYFNFFILFFIFFMRCMLCNLFDLTPLSCDTAFRGTLGMLANFALCLWLRMIVRLLII